MIKVSIIVPMYNVENYIEKCVKSCMNQTLEDIEIILVDDESKDNTLKIAKSIAKTDSRIKVITQKNSGVSVARNNGIINSSGEWLFFLDGDDWLEKDGIEKLFSKAEKEKCDIVIGKFYTNYPNEEKNDSFFNFDSFNFSYNDRIELMKACLGVSIFCNTKSSTNVGVPWAKLYNKNFINSNNLNFVIGLKRMQDTIFNLNAFYNSNKVVYLNENVCHYRINNQSATHKYMKDFSTVALDVLNNITLVMEKYSLNKELINCYNVKATKLVLETIKLELAPMESSLSRKEKINCLRKLIDNDAVSGSISIKNNRFLRLKDKLLNLLLCLKMYNVLLFVYEIKFRKK